MANTMGRTVLHLFMIDRHTDHTMLSFELVFSFTAFPKTKLQTVISKLLELAHVLLVRVMLTFVAAKN